MSEQEIEIFEKIVRSRRSVRGFLPQSIEPAILRKVLELAQTAPSNCNTQPWQVCLVSGETAKHIKQSLSEKLAKWEMDMDFPMQEKYHGEYRTRQCDAAARLYTAMGIERHDMQARQAAFMRNYQFFDAPYAALLFLPEPFSVREAADVGMYAQNLMLALTAYGIASCPQAALSFHAGAVREILQLPDSMKLLFGISFGYEDETVAANKTRISRSAIEETVKFFD